MVDRPPADVVLSDERSESSATVRVRVKAARLWAAERGVATNAELSADQLHEFGPLDRGATDMLHKALERGSLSPRGAHRLRRVAITISDLRDAQGPISRQITAEAMATAMALRTEPDRLLAEVGQ